MTAVDELLDFLRAQLDEDERVARDAGDDSMQWNAGDEALYDELRTLAVAPYGGALHEAAHIARWDPARVLAEVEAKRRILEIHHHVECRHERRYGPDGDCDECGNEWPCETVSTLAQPYAGQPGWREEWQLSDGA